VGVAARRLPTGGHLVRAIGGEQRPKLDQRVAEAAANGAVSDLSAVYRPEANPAFDFPLAFPVYLLSELVRLQRSVPFSHVGPSRSKRST
jgi:hypothetical protein